VTTEAIETIELTAEEAIARLRPFQEHRDPCEKGHVEHTADDHLGRRLIHSVSPKGFGADWGEDAVVDFIRRAARIVDLQRSSHTLAVFSDGRWIRFEAAPGDKP
jgi:hypothetical protein